jgi:DNA-binding NarL/FixJ family response regulator
VRRVVVVEGSAAAFDDAVREAERSDVTIVRSWWRDPTVVCVGTVASAQDASEALLAVLAGAGVVIDARAEREVVDRLLDDLRHLGEVDYRTGLPDRGPDLSADERGLLELLAAGHTLGEAASALHLSRRTADRRLVSAREKLGAASTAEAIAAVIRRGGSAF